MTKTWVKAVNSNEYEDGLLEGKNKDRLKEEKEKIGSSDTKLKIKNGFICILLYRIIYKSELHTYLYNDGIIKIQKL